MTTISDASPIPIPTSQPKLSGSYAALPNAIKIAVFISAATLLFIVLSLLLSLCVYYHKRFRRPRESPDIRLSNFTPRPSSTATGNTLPLYAPRDLTIGIPHHSTYFQRPPSYATEHSGDVSGPSATRGGVSMVLGSTCELDGPFSDVPLSPAVPEASITHATRGGGRVPLDNLKSLPLSNIN